MNPITFDRVALTTGNVFANDPVVRPRNDRGDALTVTRVEADGRPAAPSQGVQLTAPLPASQQRLEASTRADINRLVQSVRQDSVLAQRFIAETTRLGVARLSSVEDFEIELAKLTGELESTQKKLKLEEITRAREQNLQKMDENQKKIKESTEAAKEAQKSGLVGKIFGWVSAIASIIVGAIMVATGVGAVAGALMIAGGVMGIVSQSVQQAAKHGLISKEVMEKLGPALMGIEITIAVIAAVASFGGTAVGAVAKLGAKIGGKAAELTASVAAKVTELGAKFGSAASQSISHGVKLGVQISDVTLDVANGFAQTANSVLQAKAADKQADVLEARSELTQFQNVLDKLKEELSRMVESFLQIMELIFQMINAKGDSLHNLSSRPAAI
ncbi:type III secretion system translocon subunit SctE [Pseudomonas sp. YeP6b]|uniref:type III secretion system translocon subunit SctE n=1 Tax=Pseudomonas sp. YeP6b TaxID=2861775 RepID=UPI0021DA41BF|nr:type III secretion system translocon subunit SctE [Pseudomonas sp. YeP6b]UXZ22826.1 type III secretion system translocon subunit SctE [Pseudomonas sp. YeP6b]